MSEYKPPYTITSKMVNFISEISQELVRIEHNEKSGITPRLRKKNLIKTLAGTLAIEGNHLGEEKITALLDGKRVLGTITELAEVEGAINTYKQLEHYQPNQIEHLLKAHKTLMKGILSDAGEFRQGSVGVGNHVAPPAKRVAVLMQDLFQWLNHSDEHPLIQSCVFHYEFEFIHPFMDGNGRMGRLWQTLILYHWNPAFSVIPTESCVRDHQQRYYDALESAGQAGDSTKFIEFMLDIILIAIKSSVKSSGKSSVNTADKILSYFSEHPTATIKEVAEYLDLTTRAIEKQVASLKANLRLKRTGSARKGVWEVKL
jgi:Fic family protein